jgi:uncharacterized protein YjdB
MVRGRSLTLIAAVSPASANQAVNWSTSNPAIVSVNNGAIVAISHGTAVITATSVADATKSAQITITVDASVPIIRLSNTNMYLRAGTPAAPSTAQMLTHIMPSLPGQTLIWTSSNPSVATVNSNGLITALSAGTATITAALAGTPDSYARCVVTVGTKAYEYTVYIDGDEMPAGLLVDPNTGAITSLPTEPGTYDLLIFSTDEDGEQLFSDVRIRVLAPSPSAGD